MRICLLCSVHDPYDKRTYHKVAVTLVRAGHEVMIVSAGDREHVSDAGIRMIPYTRSTRTVQRVWSLVPRAFSLLNLLRLGLRVRAEVYQCQEPDSWLVGLVIKLIRLGRAKVVYDAHEHYPSTLAESFPAWSRTAVEKLMVRVMRAMARMTDHIVLTSLSLGEALFAGLETPQSLVMNCGYPPDRADGSMVPSRRLHPGDFILLHVGRMGSERGLSQLQEMLAELRARGRSVCLALLGGLFVRGVSDPRLVDERLRLATELGVRDMIEVLDWVPFEQVADYLADADVGLITFLPDRTNNRMGLPHKLFDYMGAGLSVIAPPYPETRRIVEEVACGILVDPTDARALAAAVEYLMDHPSERKAMGENGRVAVLRKYNWNFEAAKLLAVYEGLG